MRYASNIIFNLADGYFAHGIKSSFFVKKQIIISMIANGGRVVLGFVFFWQVSQALDLAALGEYLYVIAALGYFGTLIDYGFNLFVLNTASRAHLAVRSLFLQIVLSKLVLTVLSFALLTIIYGMTFSEQGLEVTALFYAIVILQSYSGLLVQFFKAMGRFEHELTSAILGGFLPVAILFALQSKVTLVQLGCIVLGVRLVVLLFQLGVFTWITCGQDWHEFSCMAERRISSALKGIRLNFNYAIFSIMGSIFLSVDLLVMRWVLGPEEVALYGTAMKIIMAGILFFEVLHGTFTPRLAQLHESKDENFSQEVKQFISVMLVSAMMFSLLIFVFGPNVIVWAFGVEFVETGTLVRVLSLILVLRVAEMITGPLLTIWGLQTFRARVMIVVLPVHIGLNVLLQPQFGMWGAVVTLVISFSLLFALNSIYLIKNIKSPVS